MIFNLMNQFTDKYRQRNIQEIEKTPRKKLTVFFSNSIKAHKWGGGEKWMILAAKGLRERGHRVILSGKANSVFLQKAQNEFLETLPLNISADYSPFKIWNTKRILDREKIDVILLNLNKDIRVAGIAARLSKVPVIIARNGIKLISDKWKHNKTMGLVDGIITNSESIRETYNQYAWMPKNKTRVIYNGIEINGNISSQDLHLIYNIPAHHTVFVAAGRLTSQKGFDLLIKGAAQINNKENPFTVLIAGKGKNRMQLENLIETLQLKDRIKLIGFQENLLPILNASDFVLLTSRKEGMPNIVMESMALGKPVLAARVNGVSELLTHRKTGYIFEPFDQNEIQKAMEWAIKHKGNEEVLEWGCKAQEFVTHEFTLSRMIDNLEDYFYEHYARKHR